MKVVILTLGSRGDVQPYLALAVGLQQAGHQVTLAVAGRTPQDGGQFRKACGPAQPARWADSRRVEAA